MLELVALAQSAPGATSVNTTMLVGYRIFGFKGAIVSAVASVLPPLIVISIITPFYEIICSSEVAANALKGVRACAAALVMSVSLSLAISLCNNKDYFNIVIWILAMVAAIVFKVNTLIIILVGILIGILHLLFFTKNERRVNK